MYSNAQRLGLRYPRPRWTEKETDYLRRYYPHIGAAACAGELKRSMKSVYQQASALGLRCARHWTHTEEEELVTIMAALCRKQRRGPSAIIARMNFLRQQGRLNPKGG